MTIGVEAQLCLIRGSCLVVGAGGLGSPVIQYLAAAGVGKIGIIDGDVVSITNLARQTIHSEETVGLNKAESAQMFVNRMNSDVSVETFEYSLDRHNGFKIISDYDVIVDCTDNVGARYLISDLAVFAKKPVVSGAALRTDGQLSVYNYLNGPCYRCIYPIPPPIETVGSCSDNGVLGMVTGVIGSLQAMEVVKVLSGVEAMNGRLLVFDGTCCTFRNVRLRGKRADCIVCGPGADISNLKEEGSFVEGCGRLSILQSSERISPSEYKGIIDSRKEHVLLDVRDKIQFAMCSLQAINIPLDQIRRRVTELQGIETLIVICKRGNNSQLAVKLLKEVGILAVDIIGGYEKWSQDVDIEFPIY